ncbi:hypothetical protein [Chryseobacterium sp.]|uniref:hypothetical protein n=1 Tax=Chryseobacterium sp. TaxID=1871047 RepID=UPI0028A0E43F|nr:hypothetical protein [Chryseobacterium sp.]
MSVNLLLNQIAEQFSNSRSNVYSDNNRDRHFANLYEVFTSIQQINEDNKILDKDLPIYKQILTYILSDLQYLDSSTLNVIPFEIVSSLELALKDWIDDKNLILSTHLSNDFNDFYFNPNNNKEYFDNVNTFLESQKICKIDFRLIKITLPKLLSRDYFSIVALYHELGHFVDFEFNFSKRVLLKKYSSSAPDPKTDINKELNYYQEYFADLFAAQYISDASNLYLLDRSIGDNESFTHPRTSERILLVNKFLAGEDHNGVIKQFQEVLDAFSRELKIRFSFREINKSNFFNFIPEIIENDEQLHYIYKTGWEIWKDNANSNFHGIPERQKYQIINNLMEKSISSYFLVKNWNK